MSEVKPDTPKCLKEQPLCERCGTPMETLGWDYDCPLPASACQSIAALRAENEALRKRNEELEHNAANDDYECPMVHLKPTKTIKAHVRMMGRLKPMPYDFEVDPDVESLRAQLSASELHAQELETKLRAAEDAVVVLRKVLEDEEAILSSNPYPPTLGPQAFFRHKMLQDLLSNTSALAAQRKREIQREAVDRDSRAQFEKWLVEDYKCVVGSSDPYPARIERDMWKCWTASRAAILGTTEPG